MASGARWRLATFNLESLDEKARDPEGFAARLEALRPILEKLDADVLCLQEVNAQGHGGKKPRRFTALDHLLEGTSYAPFHRAHSVNPQTGQPADVHNLVTLSRWPIVAERRIFHDFVPVWRMPQAGNSSASHEIRFDRAVLAVEIAAPFGALHVFNLHLRAPRAAPYAAAGRGQRWSSNAEWAEGFHLAALKRQGQALEARLAIDAIFAANPDAGIAVCGDLNAESFETPARILRGTPDEGDPALDARRLDMLEQTLPEQQRYSVIHDGRRVMLDHIMVSPVLARACEEIAVFNEGLADEAHVEGLVAGSLHAPVVAAIRS